MQFFTRFSPAPACRFESKEKSLTQQSFRDECDINVIIKRYQEAPRSDAISLSGPRVPMWGDFSHIPDIRQAHDFFQTAEASFSSLPADIRERFHNSPLELLSFVETASPEEQRAVLGKQAPKAAEPIVAPSSTVAEVNQETLEKNA